MSVIDAGSAAILQGRRGKRRPTKKHGDCREPEVWRRILYTCGSTSASFSLP
jgi:hypothetical protein